MFTQTPKNRVTFRRGLTTVMLGVLSIATILYGGFVFHSQKVYAATNSTINFQARLEGASGAIVPDGYYNIEFKLYSASTGGTALWTEDYYYNGTHDNRAQVTNGYVTVNLGSQTAFPTNINWDQNLYLTMNIGGTAMTTTPTYDGEMSPRLGLTAVPYSFRAGQLSQYNATTTFTSTLGLLQPTVGNQTFQVDDQAAAGTYTLCVQGATVATGGCAPSTGGSGYIQNQSASAQTTSNFWISGTGIAATALQAPSFDTPSAAALNIGTTNATSINIGKSGVNTFIGGNLSVGTTQSLGAITLANGSWISSVDSTGSGTLNEFSANSSNQIQVGAALSVDGGVILPTDGGQLTFSDLPIDTTAAAGTKESYSLRVGSTNALTVYGEADGSGNAQNIRVAVGSSISPAYTLDVGGDVNTTGAYRTAGTTVINSSGVLQSASLTGTYGNLTGVGTLTTGTWNGSTIAAIYGGTGWASYTVGDILYASGTTTIGRLNDVATGSCLISGGTSTAPTWGSCSGGGNYVNLQSATPGTAQTGNINVSGSIIAGTILQASALDTATSGILTIGATNATSISLSKPTSVMATIANTSGAAGLTVTSTASSSTNAQYGLSINNTVSPSAASTQNYAGLNDYQYSNSANASGATLYGAYYGSEYGGASQTGLQTGGYGYSKYSGTGTLGTAIGSAAQVLNSSTGMITTATGMEVYNPANTGSIGTNNGIYIANQTAGASNYGLYVAGASTDAIYVANGATYLGGSTTVQSNANSATAFQVQNATAEPVFDVDTTNTVNILTNPGFEIGITGWAQEGSGTVGVAQNLVKTNTYAGVASLAVTTQATAGQGGKTTSFTTALSSSTTYTLSFYAKLASGTMTTLQAGRADNGSTETNCTLNSSTLSTAGFQRYSCSFTTGTVSGTPYIYIRQSDAVARTIYIDDAQMQAGSSVTPYYIGAVQLRGVLNSPIAVQTISDSTSAFQIQNSAGTSNLFVADTLDSRVGIGTATPGYTLDVQGGDINTSGNIRVGSATVISSSGLLQSASLTGTYGSLTGVGTLTSGTWNASTIGVQYGGTGLTSYNIGDILYASGTTTIGKLSDVAAGSCLKSGGTNTAPTWGTCTSGSGVTLQSGTPGTPDTGNINVSGTIIAGTTLQAPALDRATAGTLTIGGTNATLLAITPATTIANNLTDNAYYTAISGSADSIDANLTLNPTGASTASSSAVNSYVYATGASMGGTGVIGVNSFNEYNASGGTLNYSTGLNVGGSVDAGNINSVTGVAVANYSGAGTVTNNFGINIGNETKGTSTNYGLYISGASTASLYIQSGTSYFGGNTIIQTNTNSTTGFQIQNAAGASFFTADSVNKIITTDDLDVGNLANAGSAARLFSDGFENGTFNQWMNGVTSAGSDTASVSSTVVRNGKYAAKFTNAGSNPGGASVSTTILNSTTLDYRAYVDVTSTSTSISILGTSSSAGTFTLYRDTSSGKLGIINGVTSASTLGSAVLATSGWHQIEMDITAGSSTGTITLYLDGNSVLSLTGQNTGTTGFTSVSAGDPNNSHTNTFYVDDVSVDTVRPGDSSSLNVADSLHVSGSASIAGNLVAGALAVTNSNSLINEATNVGGAYLGFIAGTPRLLLADGTPTDTVEVDNSGGTFRVFNPGSTPKILVTPNGGTVINGFSTAAQFQVDDSYGGQVAAVIQGTSSQTSDLLDLWSANNGTTPVTKFNSQGALTLGNTGGTAAYAGQLSFADGSTDGYTATLQTGTLTANHTVTIQNLTGTIAILQSGAAIAQTGSINASATISAGAALQSPSLDVATAGTLSIGTSLATTINIATNAASHTIGLGSSSGGITTVDGSTINLGNTNIAHTFQIGTGGTSTIQAVNIGSVYTGSTTSIDGATISIGTSTSAHTINIATGGTSAQAVVIGSTSSASKITLAGANASTTTTFQGIQVGLGQTSDANRVLFEFDTYNTFADTASTCSTTINPGSMYYNSASGSFRACVNGAWEDMASTGGLGLITFGIVPDSTTATNIGDLSGNGASGATSSGPCKVYMGSTLTAIRWTACTAYSGGRKVLVAAQSTDLTVPTGTGWVHICLNATSTSQPTFNPAATPGSETANLPAFSANSPIVCIADVNINANSVTQIFDTRTFTTTDHDFASTTTATALGTVVVPSGTAVAQAATSTTGADIGVVVATAGNTSGTPNLIIADGGPVWAKSAGTATAGDTVINSSSGAGYVQASTPSTASATIYGNMGFARTSSVTTCTAATASSCQDSIYFDWSVR